MTTFALVHGAWHGAWCWERLIPEIAGHGHAAIAVDLPCDDVEAGCAAYAEVVLAQIAQADDDLVLVGHSLGGLTIPLVAAARPARKLVFLCGAPAAPRRGLRRPGRAGARDLRPRHGTAPSATIRIARSGPMRTRRPTCSTAAARVSSPSGRRARLRPQARTPRDEPCPLAEWPAVESVVALHERRRGSSTRTGRARRRATAWARTPSSCRVVTRPSSAGRPSSPRCSSASASESGRRDASGSARPAPLGPSAPAARGARAPRPARSAARGSRALPPHTCWRPRRRCGRRRAAPRSCSSRRSAWCIAISARARRGRSITPRWPG